ncbi:MAG: hypothetical protein ACYTFW_07225 [Planctomycetota bacterium]|jgi:hypothetical protein
MKKATTLAKTEKIRKNWLLGFAIMMVSLSGSTAFALDPMGPPAAGLKQGQVKAGVDYAYSKMDLELSEGTWIEFLDGAYFDSGEATSFTLKDFKVNRIYANLGYGAADNCELFLRLGGTGAEFDDSIWQDGEDFETDTDFTIGGGVKVTFLEAGDLKLGGLFQVNGAEFDGKLDAPHWSASDFVEVDLVEAQIAVGATYTWADRISVYGGPFLHFVSGDLDDTFSEVDAGSGGLLTSEYYWEVNEDSVFGGYIGAQLEFTENCSFNIEYQHTSAADAFGASLMFRF